MDPSVAAPSANQNVELKAAYSSGKLPGPVQTFNIGTILAYFIESRADFKAIRSSSFELYTSGHVQVCKAGVMFIFSFYVDNLALIKYSDHFCSFFVFENPSNRKFEISQNRK